MKHTVHFPKQQSGAVLFIALIMLLVITVLAVSSMREVTLEARITGNYLEQKRLNSAAESALREGERKLADNGGPPESCAISETAPCVKEVATEYDADYEDSTEYSSADLSRSARWYVRDTGVVGSSDPQCFLTGKGCTNYYEVNGQAFKGDNDAGKECGPNAVCMRSVEAATYN